MRNRWPLVLWLALLWVHRGGWWHGGVYLDEDVAAVFFTAKSRLYELVRGREAWSWWDPLTLLGWPRLANVQVSWLSPFNLWFILLPPLWAWRLYPLAMDSLLLAASFWAIRQAGASPAVAGWATLVWLLGDTLLSASQQPCYKESVLSAVLAMGCALRYWRYRQKQMLAALAGCGYLHLASGSPSALFFNHLSLALLMPWLLGLWRPPQKTIFQSLMAYLGGALLALPAWLPLLEFVSHSQRSGVAVAETFRLTYGELLMRLASESHIGSSTPMVHAMGYSLRVDGSLAVLLLGLSGLLPAVSRLLVSLALLTLLQTTGEAGGLLWLVHKLVPASLQIRGPERFFFLGSWALAVGAGLAWDHWRQRSLPARWSAHLLAGWAVLFGLLAQSMFSPLSYAPAGHFSPPPLPPAGGRLAVMRHSQPQPELLWETAGVRQGRPTLIMPEVVLEQGYAQGLACSQLGPDGPALLPGLVLKARSVPILKPQSPLLLGWGLTWILEGRDWVRLQPDPPRHWFARRSELSAVEFAARESGDPFATAHLDGPPGPATDGLVEVVTDRADYQSLQVRGQGLLVSADQWDPGWQCLQDGRPAPALRVNLALKGCWVQPGVRQVEWRYRPLWLRQAPFVQASGWVLLLVAWALRRRG